MIQIPDGIKNLMRSDNCTKNYRIVGDGFEITNNNIVEGSVSFTESVCSGKTLQFGAGERSVFEFQTFGVDNAIDGEISVYIEILCNSSISGSVYKSDINSYVYSIPLGIFSVESNKKKDGSSNFRSIVAYGKQDEINPNDRVYRHIESALKNGIEYKVHPEALAQCFIRSTSNLNEYSTSNAMTYSSITRKISMPEAVAYYSDNGRYVKIPSKDIEFKNTSTVEFTIEASRTEYYEVGCFLEEIDPTGELGIIICNLYLDDVLVENAWARKVCFIASNNAKIRIELNKIVEDFKIKLYYSQGIDLSTSIYLITKSITATFRTEEPEHQDGDICFLHNKPNADAVVMRSPEIVTWNACYHNDDIFNQGLSLEDWNAFMYEISELYEDLNNNGSICDQLFEPYDMTGIFDRFRLSQARKTISYTPSGNTYTTQSQNVTSILYTATIQSDIANSYVYKITNVDMISDLLVKLPPDYSGNIDDFVKNTFNSVAEIYGLFYKQTRNGIYDFFELTNDNLVPSNDLVPSNSLVPYGISTVNTKNLVSAIYDNSNAVSYNQIDYKYRDDADEYSMSCYGWQSSEDVIHVLHSRIPIYNTFTIDIDFKYNGKIVVNCPYHGKMYFIYENHEEEYSFTSATTSRKTIEFVIRHGIYRNVKQIRFEIDSSYVWSSFERPIDIWQYERIPSEDVKVYSMSDNTLFDFIISDGDATRLRTIINNTLNKMKNISYRPGDYTFIGRPDIESGDIVEIHVDGKAYAIPVLRRVMSGEQLLMDKLSIGE